MSAAVMTSAVYDFGDTLLKNNSSAGRSARGVRWGGHGEGVVSPAEYQREGLSRRASNPVQQQPHHHGLTLNMAQLVIQLDSAMPSAPSTPSSATPPTPGAAHRKLDRSHSEPANPSAACKASAGSAASGAANINTSRYKTELCRPFEESGSCKYGDKCQFAHGAHELRTLARHPKYKTELCRTYHTIGLCPYGPRCHFVHNDEELLANGSPPQGPAQAHSQAHGPAAKPPPALSALPALPALPRPKALTLASPPVSAPVYLAGSTADSPSPTSSLSQSPTNSHRSFFMSSEDVFGSVSPTPSSAAANTAFSFGPDFATLVHGSCPPCAPVSAPSSVSSRDSPSPPGSPFRLPIFNHLSNQVMKIRLDV